MFEIPLWFIYVFLAFIFRWFYSFLNKVLSEKNLDYNSIFIISFFIELKDILNIKLFILGTLSWIIMYFNSIIPIKILKNLSSSTMFINTRIFGTIIVFILSFFIFKETLSTNQLIWIVLGIIIFVLLYDNKDKPKLNSDYKKWIFFLFLYIILMATGFIINKLTSEISVFWALFYFSVIPLIIFLFKSVLTKKFIINDFKNKEKIKYWLLFGSLNISMIYFLFSALPLFNTTVIYKIYSFEIFIPIILSVFIYKEKITTKKLIAFILTFISIWFFL
jgi:drug/metabolite transporter (DMT)-like permease